MTVHEIKIDLEKKCIRCGKDGAIHGVTCLNCLTLAIKNESPKTLLAAYPDYFPASPDVAEMAAKLINEHHPEASNAKIAYVFRKKHGKTGDKIRLGSCARQSDKQRLMHNYDYIIELAFDMWLLLEPVQREALLLHKLCHVFKDEDESGAPKWKVEPHNVEEFDKVILVYGLWKPDLESMAKAIWEHQEEHGTQLRLVDSGKGE